MPFFFANNHQTNLSLNNRKHIFYKSTNNFLQPNEIALNVTYR